MCLRNLLEYTKLPDAPNNSKNEGEETTGGTLGITIKFVFIDQKFQTQPLAYLKLGPGHSP